MTTFNVIEPDISNIGPVISNVLSALFGLIGLIAGINMLLTGIKLASSQGDPKALAAAKARFTWAVLGFLIAIGVFTIIRLVGSLVGFNFFPIVLNTDL